MMIPFLEKALEDRASWENDKNLASNVGFDLSTPVHNVS